MSISLWLEKLPPSVNANTRFGTAHAYSSPRYREWSSEAVPDLKEQARGASIDGPYKLSITAARPDKRKRDIDNIIKPLSDALQKAGVIANDHYCEFISARWVTTGDGVAIRIEPVGVE